MSLLSYSGLSTKIRAMSRYLITDEQFQDITYMKSIDEFITYIKNTPGYSNVFEHVSADNLHREDVERLLRKDVFNDFTKLYRFANSKQRDFLDLYFLRYQVSIIKSCLKKVANNQYPELDLSLYQDFFLHHSKLNLDKLSSSTSIKELVENLKGSDFYKPLSKLLDYRESTIYDFEVQLDAYYYTSLWKNRKKYLSGEDLDIVTHTYGCQIDMLNIEPNHAR